jgi:hypothetical protein
MMAFDYVKTLEAMNKETGKFESAVSRIQGNKAFLAFRRFLTGTDIWRTMNKMMGLLNIYNHFNNLGKKQNEQLIAQINNWKTLAKQMEELKFTGPIAGYKSVIELADKFDAATGDFSGMNPLESYTAKMQMWDTNTNTGSLEEIGMLMEKGYNQNDATQIVLDMLKPLQKQAETAAILAKQEIELYKEANPMKKWFKKQRHKLENFANADWVGFAKFIGKGLLILAVLPLIAFVLFQFFRKSKNRWKQIKATLAELKGLFDWGLSSISEGVGKMITAFEEGNFGMLLSGLLDIGLGIVAILTSAFLTFIVLPLTIVLYAIWDSLKAKWDESIANGEGTAGAFLRSLLSLISLVAALVAGIAILSSAGWLWILGSAIVSAIAYVFSSIGLHTGGMAKGMTIVGERGPELVNLPGGSRVYSNSQSRNMAGGGNTINVNVTGRVGASDAEIRDIANKVGQQINLRMNRTGAMNTGF